MYKAYIQTHFRKAKPAADGVQYTALCHLHEDSNPSLLIDSETGRVACQGCQYGGWMDQYAKEAGLPEPPSKLKKREKSASKKSLGKKPSRKKRKKSTVVTRYIYRDHHGNNHMKVERTTDKQFYQSRWEDGKWKPGVKSGGKKIEQLPYHLPEILATAAQDKPILWCEGEKDVDMARGLGCCATTSPGGCGNAGKLDDWEVFRGRKIWILPDNDDAGEKYLHITAKRLLDHGAVVRVCRLPELGKGGDLFDWLNMGYGKEQLAEQLDGATIYEPPAEEKAEKDSKRPRICVSGREVLTIAREVMEKLAGTGLFYNRKGEIVFLQRREGSAKPFFVELAGEKLKGYLICYLEFYRNKKIEEDEFIEVPATPHANLLAAIYPLIGALPKAVAIREIPYVNRRGELVLEEGLDEDDQILFIPFTKFEVPDLVEKETAADALRWLQYYFLGDFPFEKEYHRTHALSALFQAFLAPYINHKKPMYLFDANMAGTGKTMLAEVIGGVASVSRPTVLTMNPNPEKACKDFFSALAKNEPCLVWDNLKGNLNFDWLQGALTSIEVSFLLPYGRRPEPVSTGSLVIGTGNNVTPHPETGRRMIPVRMLSTVERPENLQPDDFTIPDIEAFAESAKMEILTRVLHVLRYWIGRGRPTGTQILGSYQRWSAVLSGLFLSLDITDFLEHQREEDTYKDESQAQWRALVKHWAKMSSGRDDWRNASQIMGMAISEELFCEELDNKTPASQKATFGKMLSRRKDSVIGGWVIRKKMGRKSALYHLELSAVSESSGERKQRMRDALEGAVGAVGRTSGTVSLDNAELSINSDSETKSESSFLSGEKTSGGDPTSGTTSHRTVKPGAVGAGGSTPPSLYNNSSCNRKLHEKVGEKQKPTAPAKTTGPPKEKTLGDHLNDFFSD